MVFNILIERIFFLEFKFFKKNYCLSIIEPINFSRVEIRSPDSL